MTNLSHLLAGWRSADQLARSAYGLPSDHDRRAAYEAAIRLQWHKMLRGGTK